MPSPALKPETVIEPYCPPLHAMFNGLKFAVIAGGWVIVSDKISSHKLSSTIVIEYTPADKDAIV